ncbi:MAG: purine/pyrimidine permease, partial [Desulfobacteraceae bacterium]|nr:purine/pyrimidine permease [Desulfobacteraceae bacterium]
ASRYAVACCGVMVMLAAFMPKLSALFALVPAPVVGATLCTAMGFQIGAAFAIIAQGGIDQRSYYVVGLPILVGTMIGFLPQEIVQQVPAIFRVFLGNGLTFGILFVLVLEHVLMRGKTAAKEGGGK